MSTMTNIDVLTDEWVQKLHFENRVDLNLQIPASGESIKVEVGDIPPEHIPQLGLLSLGNNDAFTSLLVEKNSKSDASPHPAPTPPPTSDSYLSSIVSSAKTNASTMVSTNGKNTTNTTATSTGSCQNTSDCTCYKCQRQRRRAGTRGRMMVTEVSSTPSTTPPTRTQSQSPQQSRAEAPASPRNESSPAANTPPSPPPSTNATEQPDTPKPTVIRNGSFVLRKKPSSHSYERHLPRPTYSESDSIYRAQQQQLEKTRQQQQLERAHEARNTGAQDYEISWQDESGDDILSSLRTFQTIFEEKPHGSEGLSDLLEVRAHELKMQKIYEEEQKQLMDQQQVEPNRPPKRSDCLTLSYRDGPQHKHLTLYHTMKMTGPNERMNAYGRAFQHCVRADSGLASWIEKQSSQSPPSAVVSNYQSNLTLKKSTKRSILQLPGRKQKATAEDLWLRTNKLTDSPTTQHHSTTLKDNGVTPIDVLSTANALMPTPSTVTLNQSMGKANSNKKPYDYVDTPSRPLPRSRNSVDKDSMTSFDMEQGRSTTKSGKIWSSLGRKASRSRSNAPSVHSIEKVPQQPPSIKEAPEQFEKALDDLCQIMTHVDRSVLSTYLEQSNGDYMKTLSVIRSEVTSGKL